VGAEVWELRPDAMDRVPQSGGDGLSSPFDRVRAEAAVPARQPGGAAQLGAERLAFRLDTLDPAEIVVGLGLGEILVEIGDATSELGPCTASRTIFNALLYIAPDGTIAGCHRKLMPTGGERTLWGNGDGSTLTVLDTPFGRLGGLLCWENSMPLARTAMYAQGIDVYLAPTWDNSDTWIATLRHIAKEGRVFVVGTNSCIRATDIPSGLPGHDDLYEEDDDDWPSRGNTTIVSPYGDIIEGPLIETEGILYAEVDAAIAHRARREFDAVGHYARADVFALHVDTRPNLAVTFQPVKERDPQRRAKATSTATTTSRQGETRPIAPVASGVRDE